MGVVYRALDIPLNREVALKVLPPDRRRRRIAGSASFARRRRLAIEHPTHRRHPYEIGEQTAQFIAMELIRGETLEPRSGAAAAAVVARARDRGRGRGRPGARARERRRPSRHQAGQRDAHRGRPREIIDFGLAKLIGALSGDAGETTVAPRPTRAW